MPMTTVILSNSWCRGGPLLRRALCHGTFGTVDPAPSEDEQCQTAIRHYAHTRVCILDGDLQVQQFDVITRL